jgi:hypothetical protein
MFTGMTIATPVYPDFNMYDIREPCVEKGLCYPNDHLGEVLNSELYRKKFNMTGKMPWEMCAPAPHIMLSFD